MSPKHEYFAVRNSAGFFDTSPLYKYRITRPDAERLLAGVMTRDIRLCRPGRAQYTVWCDDRGFVLEDGVRLPALRDRLPAHRGRAEPRLLQRPDRPARRDDRGRHRRVRHARRAGPAVARDPRQGRARGRASSAYFEHTDAKIGKRAGDRSRAPATPATSATRSASARDDALDVLDAVIEAGEGHGLRPFGEEALLMTRIEAGLVLINVEFSSSRFAYTDHDRITPKELGLRLDAQGHRRRRPPVHRPRRHPPRARREDVALGDRRAASSTGPTTTGSTTRPASSRRRTRRRWTTSRCCTTTTASGSATPPA